MPFLQFPSDFTMMNFPSYDFLNVIYPCISEACSTEYLISINGMVVFIYLQDPIRY